MVWASAEKEWAPAPMPLPVSDAPICAAPLKLLAALYHSLRLDKSAAAQVPAVVKLTVFRVALAPAPVTAV